MIAFEDVETESPMGESPHSRSETFTLCPQTCAGTVCLRECMQHRAPVIKLVDT